MFWVSMKRWSSSGRKSPKFLVANQNLNVDWLQTGAHLATRWLRQHGHFPYTHPCFVAQTAMSDLSSKNVFCFYFCDANLGYRNQLISMRHSVSLQITCDLHWALPHPLPSLHGCSITSMFKLKRRYHIPPSNPKPLPWHVPTRGKKKQHFKTAAYLVRNITCSFKCHRAQNKCLTPNLLAFSKSQVQSKNGLQDLPQS